MATKGHPWLRGALAEAGYQQKDVAEAWGCDSAVVSRFINSGDPPLTFDRANILARMLDLTLDELNLRLAENLPALKRGVALPKPSLKKPTQQADGEDNGTLDVTLDRLNAAVKAAQTLLHPRGGKVRVTITYGNGNNGD